MLRQRGYDSSQWTDATRTQDIIDSARNQWEASPALKKNGMFVSDQNAIFRLLDEFEFEGLAQSHPHEGSVAILKKIKHSDILTGVVTNSGRAPVESVLTEFGFSPYLSIVITRNEMEKLKPHPHGLIKAMKVLNVTPSESLYVGDSVIDIEAAKKAQMKCASVSTGIYHFEALAKMSPDYALRKLEELEHVVL
jgi:HAD superfamily hydrolase (TIGR01509 family)